MERDSLARHGGRNRVAYVHAHADGEPLQRVAVPASFAQDAGELAVREQHVVRPLEPDLDATEQGVHDVRDGEPHAHRHDSQLAARWPQQHAEPHAADGRVPGPPVPSPAGRLFLGEHDAARGRALGAEVVDGVERRVEPAEQSLLSQIRQQRRHPAHAVVRPIGGPGGAGPAERAGRK